MSYYCGALKALQPVKTSLASVPAVLLIELLNDQQAVHLRKPCNITSSCNSTWHALWQARLPAALQQLERRTTCSSLCPRMLLTC